MAPAGHEHQHHGRNPSTPLPGQGRQSERAGEAITQPRSGLQGWDNLGYLALPPRMLGSFSLAYALNTCLYTVERDELLLDSES